MRFPRALPIVIVALASLAHAGQSEAPPPVLRAGQGVTDITPPPGTELAGFHKPPGQERRSTSVRQLATARALVLELKGNHFVLLSLDVCAVSPEFCRQVKEEIARKSSIPPESIRIAATHSHSMPTLRYFRQWGRLPEGYQDAVARQAVEAVELARRDLAPAELSVGKERVAEGNYNRASKAWKTDEAFTLDSGDEERWLDTTLHALHFTRSGPGRNLLWYQFSAHPVCYTDGGAGPDWPGLVASKMKDREGLSPSFLQGHCGDVNPGPGNPGLGDPEKVSEAVVAALRQAVKNARKVEVREIRQVTSTFPAPLDLDRHQEQLAEYKADPAACAKGEWVDAGFAREWFEVASRWDLSRTSYAAPISAVCLGDVALLFHPGELYSVYGLTLRRDSPFRDTIPIGYTDDLIGYLPDPQAYAAREYAALVVPKIMDLPCFKPSVGRELTAAALDLLRKLEGGDWPRFRGPNGSGVSDGAELPDRLDPGKELAWKLAVPPGTSSPVVAGGRVFLTVAEGDDRLVLAIDARSGKQLWRKPFPKGRSEFGNPLNGPASPTPALGGGSVFVFFPDTGLISLSAAGDERWRTVLGPFKSMHGIASSPVLVEGKVVVLIDQLEGSFLEAFDAGTGKPVWRAERPSGVTGGYSTPAIQGSGPGALVIASGAIELAAYSASSGERVWWATGLTNAPVGLPVVDGDRVYVCEPRGEAISFKEVAASDKNGDGKISAEELGGDPGMLLLLERLDREWGNGDGFLEAAEFEKAFGTFVGNGGLASVRLGGAGDISRTHVVWRQTKSVSYVPSVLLYRHTLFTVKDGGILTTYDPVSGKMERQARLDEAGGSYYASPVAGDGKVFLVSTAGKVSVVKAEPEWSLLSSSDLGEGVSATPAIAGGRVFIRTEKTLYCFRKS